MRKALPCLLAWQLLLLLLVGSTWAATAPASYQVVPAVVFFPADVEKGKVVLLARGVTLRCSVSSRQAWISSALGELLSVAPGPDEPTAKRLPTAIPKGTSLRRVAVRGSAITVNLSRQVLAVNAAGAFLPFSTMRRMADRVALAQIVFTATQWDRQARVRVLIEGKPGGLLGNQDISHAWARKDFRRDCGLRDNGGRRVGF